MNPWSPTHFDFADPLNADIWTRSPALQRSIQPPETLRHEGAVGAQQAMMPRGSEVLPWVPDLVGRDWRGPDGLLVVGSAYAGFIREFSSRRETMPLAEYASATSAAEFQERFLKRVVERCAAYYGPIAGLATAAGGLARIALFDLCRASFVKRGSERVHGRRDEGGDGVLQKEAALYQRYVESGDSADWLWRRIIGSAAPRIVALGRIAEHGLLRLFARHDMKIRLSCDPTSVWTPQMLPPGEWVKRYANLDFKLRTWIDAGCWWEIVGDTPCGRRTWRLLPLCHPAAKGHPDPDYVRAGPVLARMLDGGGSASKGRKATARQPSSIGVEAQAGSPPRRKTTEAVGAIGYPLPEHAQFITRVREADLPRKFKNWTGNDRVHRNHHDAVPLAQDPVYLRLRWKRNDGATPALVGCFVLQLHGLLAGGYVCEERNDPNRVRLRFYRGDGGVINIQRDNHSPGLPVGVWQAE